MIWKRKINNISKPSRVHNIRTCTSPGEKDGKDKFSLAHKGPLSVQKNHNNTVLGMFEYHKNQSPKKISNIPRPGHVLHHTGDDSSLCHAIVNKRKGRIMQWERWIVISLNEITATYLTCFAQPNAPSFPQGSRRHPHSLDYIIASNGIWRDVTVSVPHMQNDGAPEENRNNTLD